MVRPREFDSDDALERAIALFWKKGYAATTTDELLKAMGIGRQSLYNAFGDKWQLYLRALEIYQARTLAGHLQRLRQPAAALDGIYQLLAGLAPKDAKLRELGCMGVNAVGEFGHTNAELAALNAKITPVLNQHIVARIREGQSDGTINPALSPEEVSGFIQLLMAGIQVAARAGTGMNELRAMARLAVTRLQIP